MYHSWLDRWDERRALRGDDVKEVTSFALGSELAFSSAARMESIADFCDLASQAVADKSFFEEPDRSDLSSEYKEGWIKFPSSISTNIEENNCVWAKVTECGSRDRALVVFHHWNASKRYRQLARFFARRGIAVVEIAMPYHFERSRPGSLHADSMLSPNLGLTVQSVRQAVLDGRKLIRWLKSEGYEEISLLGMSLGSWVAGLVAAHDPSVSKAALLLTGGSLADMVWTGRATRSIRDSLAPEIDLETLRRAWAPFNLENYAHRLARTDLEIQIVLAKRDKVVLPEISQRLVRKLQDRRARPSILELNCGHYSLSIPPYILCAGISVAKLLKTGD